MSVVGEAFLSALGSADPATENGVLFTSRAATVRWRPIQAEHVPPRALHGEHVRLGLAARALPRVRGVRHRRALSRILEEHQRG
jgi:hypothetical protein